MSTSKNGYRKEDGSWADTIAFTFLGGEGYWTNAQTGTPVSRETGTISATGSSGVVESGDRGTLRGLINITAAVGSSPTLSIKIMTCATRGGTFYQVGSTLANVTGTGATGFSQGGLDRFVRLDYTIGGTASPSFTGSIDGEFV